MRSNIKYHEGLSHREGSRFILSEEDKQKYRQKGYLVLPGVIQEHEIREIEIIYDKFLNGEIKYMERDLCDMSGTYDDKFEDYSLVNAMLPRLYYPSIQGNIYEQITESIAKQLIGSDIGIDYDQFLTKKPSKPNAAFAWHQDMGYWPMSTPDYRTTTFSLAITDANRENGCLRCIPGSHLDEKLLDHMPGRENERDKNHRDKSHLMVLEPATGTQVDYLPVKRGGITIHNEWIVHGSTGNKSPDWRKTYVLAYRSLATIEHERELGFTHSHNDNIDIKTLRSKELVSL